MKKFLLFITVFIFSFSAVQAQDEESYGFSEGDLVLGGGISFSSSDDELGEMSIFNFAPQVHYFISDSWSIGASIGLGYVDYEGDKTSNTTIGIGARNYFLNIGERLMWYVGMGYANISGYDYEDSVSVLGAGLGINYFMNENIIIDLELADIFSYVQDEDAAYMNIGLSGAITSLSIIFKL